MFLKILSDENWLLGILQIKFSFSGETNDYWFVGSCQNRLLITNVHPSENVTFLKIYCKIKNQNSTALIHSPAILQRKERKIKAYNLLFQVSEKSKPKGKGIFGCLLPKSLKREPHDQAEMQILTIQKAALEDSPDDVSPRRGAEKNHNSREGSTDECKKSVRQEWQIHKIVEKAAMVVLPLSFLLFNAWYWIALFAHDG